jgi:hypothetical protein
VKEEEVEFRLKVEEEGERDLPARERETHTRERDLPALSQPESS